MTETEFRALVTEYDPAIRAAGRKHPDGYAGALSDFFDVTRYADDTGKPLRQVVRLRLAEHARSARHFATAAAGMGVSETYSRRKADDWDVARALDMASYEAYASAAYAADPDAGAREPLAYPLPGVTEPRGDHYGPGNTLPN